MLTKKGECIMRALKYFLISLLVVSIVKKTRTQDNVQLLAQVELATATPANTKLRVTKGFKNVGHYLPDTKMVQSTDGQTLFLNVIEERLGNYTKTGSDEEKLLLTKAKSTEILEKIGTVQHQGTLLKGPSKVTLYGIKVTKPIIHRT